MLLVTINAARVIWFFHGPSYILLHFSCNCYTTLSQVKSRILLQFVIVSFPYGIINKKLKQFTQAWQPDGYIYKILENMKNLLLFFCFLNVFKPKSNRDLLSFVVRQVKRTFSIADIIFLCSS